MKYIFFVFNIYIYPKKFDAKLEDTLFSYFNRRIFYSLKGIQMKEETYGISVLNRNLKHFR